KREPEWRLAPNKKGWASSPPRVASTITGWVPQPRPGLFHSGLRILSNGFRLRRVGFLAFNQAEREPGQITDADGEHDVSRHPQPYQTFHDGVVDELGRAGIPETFGNARPGLIDTRRDQRHEHH